MGSHKLALKVKLNKIERVSELESLPDQLKLDNVLVSLCLDVVIDSNPAVLELFCYVLFCR